MKKKIEFIFLKANAVKSGNASLQLKSLIILPSTEKKYQIL